MKNPYRILFVTLLISVSACNSQAHQVHKQSGYVPSPRYNDNYQGKKIASIASNQIGVRYRYGGNSRRGFDCSGLVYYSHMRNGIRVPRVAADQLRHSRRISLSRIRPGDLLFFDLGTRKISHVGIYVGRGQFIHAPSRGKRVSYASLNNPYWHRRVIAAGRYY